MPVGTGAITLQEVCDEMTGVQTSLQDCVDDYIAAGMNDTYWTSKPSDPVSLAEFRGYDGTPTITYYRLLGCGGVSNAWTTQAPSITNQRYIDISGAPDFYYHDGVTTTTLPSPLVTTNLVSGQTFCP